MTKTKQLLIILATILVVQFSFWGLRYFPIMDDNNQLGVYNLRNDNIYENVIDHYKSYNVRPLAFYAEGYIFQWFWDNQFALMIIISLMQIANVYFLYKILDKIGIKLRIFFYDINVFCTNTF